MKKKINNFYKTTEYKKFRDKLPLNLQIDLADIIHEAILYGMNKATEVVKL